MGCLSIFLKQAHSTPFDDTKQDRLVQFLKEIKLLQLPTDPAPQIWGMALWTDLPIFGASMRELWNKSRIKFSYLLSNRKLTNIEADDSNYEWTNLNDFAARLTAVKVADSSLYGIWALRAALEIPVIDIEQEGVNETMWVAAVWLKFYGKEMYAMN
jgi:hypothetical protein